MRQLKVTKRFNKDVKTAKKRGKNLDKLWTIIEMLQKDEQVPIAVKAHRLSGKWSPHWECHIEPDWLLIYLRSRTEIIWVRTGSHSDLL